MHSWFYDLRHSVRRLRKSPGLTTAAVLTLAVALGLNTAIFSLAYGALYRALPFPEAERIIQLAQTGPSRTQGMPVTARGLEIVRQQSTEVFAHLAGQTEAAFNLAAGRPAERVRGAAVSASYFSVLGIPPALGRSFLPEEDRGSGTRVVVLSHRVWTQNFNRSTDIVGRTVQLNGENYEVIGIMPAGFDPRSAGELNGSLPIDVWVPLSLLLGDVGGGTNISVLGRIRADVTPPQLEAASAALTAEYRQRLPRALAKETRLVFRPYQQALGADARRFLLPLLGAGVFVLLIACTNVANLFLARASARKAEYAIHTALGATRGRLFRQSLADCLLVALAGGGAGWALAVLGQDLLLSLAPAGLPRLGDVQFDGAVFGVTLLVSILSGLAAGMLPALFASRTDLIGAMKDGGASARAGGGSWRRGLVVAGVALAFVLIVGAGLMVATFVNLSRTALGFDPARVVSAQFWMVGSRHADTAAVAAFFRDIEARLQALPGVEAVGFVSAGLPLERGGNNGVQIAGAAEPRWLSVDYREVTPGFLRTLGVPLREGRAFSATDDGRAAPVAHVNEAFVRTYLPDRPALGTRLLLGEQPVEIVGVIGDLKSRVDEPAEPAVFIPAAQADHAISMLFENWFARHLLVRTQGDPQALSRAIAGILADADPGVAVGRIRPMDEVFARAVSLPRFLLLLLGIFGGVALLLASTGLYGVISHSVAARTREIGVRLAIGADPERIGRLVLRGGLGLVLPGIALGAGASLLLTRMFSHLIYGVEPADPRLLLLAALVLLAVGVAACWLPARRAARVDPMVALRAE